MALALLAAVSILAAGCSSSGSPAAKSSVSSSQQTSNTAAAPKTTSSTTPKVSALGGGQFCQFANNAKKSLNAGSVTSGTPASLQADFTKLKAEEPLILAAAPVQIKGDFQTLFTVINKFYSALASAGYNYTKVPPAALQSFGADSAQMQAASKAITSYLATTCHLS